MIQLFNAANQPITAAQAATDPLASAHWDHDYLTADLVIWRNADNPALGYATFTVRDSLHDRPLASAIFPLLNGSLAVTSPNKVDGVKYPVVSALITYTAGPRFHFEFAANYDPLEQGELVEGVTSV